MESQLRWNDIVCNLTTAVPTEQRSMHFSRTNITDFRRVLHISQTWLRCADQPSNFSIPWEYIPCRTSCEQCSHHFAFWQKQTVAQDPLLFLMLWRRGYTFSPQSDCSMQVLQLMGMFTCHTQLPSQGLPFSHSAKLQPPLAAGGVQTPTAVGLEGTLLGWAMPLFIAIWSVGFDRIKNSCRYLIQGNC